MDNSMADFSNGQTPNMQLATKFELGKVQFEGYLEKNQNKSFLYAKSASETTVDLIKLANSFLPEGVNLPKDLPFEFTNLFLSVCSKGELNFRAQTVSSWEITEDFTIHSGKLNLKLIKNPSTHERAFTGLIEGKSKLFDIDTTVKVTIAEQLKMSVIVPEIKLDNLLARYAANLELPSEFPLKDLILKNLEVNIIPLTGEMSFKGNSTSTFQMPLGGANIEFTNVEFYLSLDQDQQIGCNIQVKGKSILNPELKLDEFELILDFKNDKWSIEGATDMYMLETKTSLGVTILKEKSKSLLSLKSKLKLPIKLSQLLKSIGIENNALPEDLTHLDAELESLEFTIDNHKKINFIGGVSLTNQSNLQIGEEVLPLASFHFDIQILDEETEVKLSLKGGNLPQLASIDAQIKSYLFQFEINKRKENTTDWKLSGNLHLEAFERMMMFKASASSLGQEQSLSFHFDSSTPFLTADYFNGIEGVKPIELLKVLNDGDAPANDQIDCRQLTEGVHHNLGEGYTTEQKEEIGKVIAKTKKANEPLLVIPDLLNNNKPLCTINPRSFSIELKRSESRFEQINFSIGSDLTLYNTWMDQALFTIKNGIISSGFNKIDNEFYLEYKADSTQFKPLSAISMIPGIKDLLQAAFGETQSVHPKTDALLNLMEIELQAFSFIKKEDKWEIHGGVRLVLTEGLKVVDPFLYEFVEKLFPKSGDVRYLEGGISYDSKDGLVFILKNNSGIEIPNLLAEIAKSLDPQFKSDFKIRTGINLEEALDLGESFVIVDQLRLKIAKESKLDIRLGIGLPSRLNDFLFRKEAKIHGLIKTYDRKKFEQAAQLEKGKKVNYNAPLPDDNLIRASLRISADGISGQLEKVNILNIEKITEEFTGLITEVDGADYILVNLNALTPNGSEDYGKLKIDKPIFEFNFKTYALTIGGGIEVMSDSFKIPVSPFVKKIIGFLPKEKFEVLSGIADMLTDSITLRSLSFYDKESGQLSVDDLLNFLKQFLLKEHQNIDLIRPEELQLLKDNSKHITNLLPESLLSFLSISIPKGLRFKLEIPADQSVAFSLEIPEPTVEQKKQGFSEYIQFLVPEFQMPFVHLYGVRLKKIGVGSALFNNAIRLDFSGEFMTFRYPELAVGMGMSLIRNSNTNDERLQRMMPNVKEFENRLKIENLLMFIFPQTTVPIPVPIFYDEVSISDAGILGGKAGLTVKLPRPSANAVEIFKSFGEITSFFSKEDFAFSIDSYGKLYNPETPIEDSIIPRFHAGPIYLDLPGILGYQNVDNHKKPITLGFKDVKILSPKDLFEIAANTVKFSLRSIVEGKSHRIKIDENRAELPVNYLVKYLPENQRIGSSELVLFEILEANFIWALSTPGEFKEKVLPLVRIEQQKLGRPECNKDWSGDELVRIIPNSNNWNEDHDGVVVFFKGAFKLTDQVALDIVTASSLTSKDGFATGIAMRGKLANLFEFQLGGGIKIDPNSAQNKFGLAGRTTLTLMERIPVMKGDFSMGIGADSHLKFSGMLDLFPDELFQGERSPIQLYTGVEKGQKSNITGVIDANGINIGHLNANGIIESAGVHLEIGDFHLAGTTRIITTRQLQEWELKLICHGTELTLNAGIQSLSEAKALRMAINSNKPIGIESLVYISGTEEGTGPSGELILTYPNEHLFPEFTKFYLDGKVTLLGMSSATRVEILKDQFEITLANDFGILRSHLKVSGKNFADSAGYSLNGNVNLLNDLGKLVVNATYFKTQDAAIFKGTGEFHFWGQKRMSLTIEAGILNNQPHFVLEGALDLFLISGVTRLYTGTQNAVLPVRGVLNGDKLEFSGQLQFHLNQIYLGGDFQLLLDSAGSFKLSSTMSFYAGLLSGGQFNLSLIKVGPLLELSGSATGAIELIPNVFCLEANSHLKVFYNEETGVLEQFEIGGNTSLLGVQTGYTLKLHHNSFFFHCNASLPHADLSITAKSDNLSSVELLRLSGHVDIARLNNEIRKVYEAFGIRGQVDYKAQAAVKGKNQLIGSRDEMNKNLEMITFLQDMDSRWKANGNDPDGFNYCVPPVSHIDYWSKHAIITHDWGRSPRYTQQELSDVIKYYAYKRELGLPADEPRRHDIANFVNGAIRAVTNEVHRIGGEVSKSIRNVVNELHNSLSNGLLKDLNIDTTDLNLLNKEFNKGVDILENEANRWNELNNKLLSHPLILIDQVSFEDQSVDILKNSRLTAKVSAKILGDAHTINLVLDLNDPAGSLITNLKQFLPSELQSFVQ